MKYQLLLFLTCWVVGNVGAQSDLPKGYFFDGEEVVFEFDVRDYEKVTNENTQVESDFGDLYIKKVVVSGNFNNWSREGWKMKKVSDYLYQLRKPIHAFNDQFNWEFKFLINEVYWAEPKASVINKVFAADFWSDVYNLQLFEIQADENGNTSFFLPAYLNAKKVILAGDFNGWNEESLEMKPNSNGWEIKINLDPGNYEYKFIVDGEWMIDPQNPDKVSNIHGTFNSVLSIQKKIVFCLKGFPNAKNVVLSGSFNDWSTNEMKMMKVGDKWEYQLDLSAGKHFYKFIVDGDWMIDPQNRYAENDGNGNINSVLFVQ